MLMNRLFGATHMIQKIFFLTLVLTAAPISFAVTLDEAIQKCLGLSGFDCHKKYLVHLEDATKNEDQEILKTKCDGGEKAACFVLGEIIIGGDVKRNKEGVEIFKKLCQEDHPKSCVEYANALNKSTDDGEFYRGYQLAKKLCAANDVDACVLEGKYVYYGFFAPDGQRIELPKRSVELFKKACDENNMEACHLLGKAYQEGLGVDGSSKTALRHYEKSCKMGYEMACEDAAKLSEDKSALAEDEYASASTYKENIGACGNKDGNACFSIALMFEHGQETPANMTKRREFMLKACDYGYAGACNNLGIDYMFGLHNMEKDEAKGRKYLKKACDAGEKGACKNLGNL